MKLVKVLAVGAVLCLFGSAGRGDEKADAKLLVGKWEVTKADPGTAPPGAVVEFTKDGKVTVTHKQDDKDVSISGTYKLEGKKISFALKVGDEEKTKTITITKLSAKEMTTKDENDKTVELAKK
jgi:uncharacterized protein (TIGR03066 family)